MRPTELGLRRPKDETPGFRHPVVDNTGRPAQVGQSPKRATFSTAPRFADSAVEAARSRSRIGPSSYDCKAKLNSRLKGGFVYKLYHGAQQSPDNGHYFVGCQLVYNPKMAARQNSHVALRQTSRRTRGGSRCLSVPRVVTNERTLKNRPKLNF